MSVEYKSMLESKTFNNKSPEIQELYATTLQILDIFGYPISGKTSRRLERSVGAFLALCNINKLEDLNKPEDLDSPRSMKTREIIVWENNNLEENISSGSYDDIRRKDLNELVLGHIVVRSSPNSATNDSTRGYAINPYYSSLMKLYGQSDWDKRIAKGLEDIESLHETLSRKRVIEKIPVTLPSGKTLNLSLGKHNILQINTPTAFIRIMCSIW